MWIEKERIRDLDYGFGKLGIRIKEINIGKWKGNWGEK